MASMVCGGWDCVPLLSTEPRSFSSSHMPTYNPSADGYSDNRKVMHEREKAGPVRKASIEFHLFIRVDSFSFLKRENGSYLAYISINK